MNPVAVVFPWVVLGIAELTQKYLAPSARQGLDRVLTWVMIPGLVMFWTWQAGSMAGERGAWGAGLMAAVFGVNLFILAIRRRGLLSDGRWLE